MSDIYQSAPNFVNPQYATPEQLAQLRGYSNELLKGSIKPQAKTWGGVAAALIQGIAGNQRRAEADQLQQQGIQGGTDQTTGLITELLRQPDQGAPSGAAPMPSPSGPVASQDIPAPPRPEVQSSPTVVGDKEGEASGIYPPSTPPPAGTLPPGGVQASANSPAAAPASFPQRFNGINPREIAAALQNPHIPEQSKAMIRGLITPERGTDVYGNPSTASVLGGVKTLPTAPGFFPGVRAPVSVGGDGSVTGTQIITPNGSSVPGIGNGSNGITGLAATGRELGAEAARTKAGAGAEGGVIEQDVRRAAAAPETLKGLGIMRDTINSVGDNMTFGPTAKFSNEARRVIGNYAPGLVDEKALAGADAIEKLNLGLAGSLSQQLGLNPSDIYRSVASVPGNEKSKAGTLALINMMEQAARNDQHVGTVLYNKNRGNLAAYQQARQEYYNQHPIINPITGQPISIDASKPAAASGPIRVSSPEEARKLPKGTPIILPDGRQGRVP